MTFDLYKNNRVLIFTNVDPYLSGKFIQTFFFIISNVYKVFIL